MNAQSPSVANLDACPHCDADWAPNNGPHGIEYAYDHPDRYDGVSEWSCPACGCRWGRWTGTVLGLGETEPRFGRRCDQEQAGMSDPVRIDLRNRFGFRVEVVPCILPDGQWAARLMQRRDGARTTYKAVGPNILASSPEAAVRDLMTAVNQGLLPGVEVAT